MARRSGWLRLLGLHRPPRASAAGSSSPRAAVAAAAPHSSSHHTLLLAAAAVLLCRAHSVHAASTTTTTSSSPLAFLLWPNARGGRGLLPWLDRRPTAATAPAAAAAAAAALPWSTMPPARHHNPWPMLQQQRGYVTTTTRATAAAGDSDGDNSDRGGEEDVTQNAGTFGEAPTPFAALGLGQWLVDALGNGGKPLATTIQALSIPPILAGEDVVLGSETGAGKTLAYLLPLFELAARDAADSERQRLREKEWAWFQERRAALKAAGNGAGLTSLTQDFPWEAPRAIVLVPNRQLGEQVLRMAREVLGQDQGEGSSAPNGVTIDALPGGLEGDWPFHPKTRPAPSVLVCTPAALSGFDREVGIFARVGTLVVDEADMLLEGDYGRHLDRILVAFKRADKQHLAREEPLTQYVLSAATLPTYGLKSVEELVKKRFPRAARVSTDLMHRHHPRLTQAFFEAPASLEGKLAMLLALLAKIKAKLPSPDAPLPKTMVFLNTAAAAQAAYEAVVAAGYPAVAFHKEVRGPEREENLERFRRNEVPLLVCTDLASRGLDIPDVKQVIQVEFAPNVVQHLHRIGRALRAGREGRAVNFYDPGSEDLVESLREAGDESLDRSFSRQRGFRKKIKKYGTGYYKRGGGEGGGGGGGGGGRPPRRGDE